MLFLNLTHKMFMLQEAVSFKVNAIHFLNINGAFNFLFNLFKPLVIASLRNKVSLLHTSTIKDFSDNHLGREGG